MIAEIAVGLAILAALVFVVRHFVRQAKGDVDACCCCEKKDSCQSKDSSSCGQGTEKGPKP